MVAATPTLKLSPSTLVVGGGVGTALSGSFTASGGTPPYAFSASGLPSGVTVDSKGNVGGSSGAAGTSNATVTVTDSASTPATATAQLSVQILGLTTSSLPAGAATVQYSGTFSATGGTPPYVFSASGLPAGLSVSGGGTLSGIPTVVGPASFSVQVSDSHGFTATTAYVLSIGKAPVTVNSSSLAGGAVGTPYSQTLSATGGNPPYTWWSLLNGAPPAGLSLAASGTVSGVPTTPASSSFGVQATDSSGGVASASVSLAVTPSPISITTGALPSGVVNFSYPSQVLGASGGVSPYTFTVVDGGLPPGVTLSSGVIGGTPTTAGTYPITIGVTDSANNTTSSASSIQIRQATSDLVLLSGSASFSLVTGATGLPSGQSVGVQSTDSKTPINYTVSVSPASAWLSVTGGTTTPGVLYLSLTNAALALAAGSNQATVTLTCTTGSCQGKTQDVAVSLTVASPPPQLSVANGLLSFTSSATPPQAQSQAVQIQNVGGGSLTINSVSCEASWCTVGSFPSTVSAGPGVNANVTVDPTTLALGFYRTAVDVSTSAGNASVPVTFFITQSVSMNLAPGGAQFSMPVGGAPGNSNGSFLVSVSGGNTSWTAAVSSGSSWLSLNTSGGVSSGTQPGTVNYTINSNAANLAVGAYYGTIEVTAGGVANSPQDFQVILNVTPATQPAQPDPEPAGLVFLTTAGSSPAPQLVNVFSSSSPNSPLSYQAAASYFHRRVVALGSTCHR